MKSCPWLFCVGLLAVAVAVANPEASANPDQTTEPHAALQNALRRLGLSNEWYTNMVFLSQEVEPLELPKASPATTGKQPTSLLQENAKMTAEQEITSQQNIALGTASANPTYVLPAAPMVATPLRPEPDTMVPSPPAPFALFPPANAFAYNPYSRIPYGYAPAWRAPIYAPGGGAPVMGGDPNAGATDPTDYFAAQPIQDPSRDVARVYAGGSTNPLWFPSPTQRGSLAYFPGIVAAAPQGPTSEPIPFTSGDNPPNDFPAFRQRLRAAAAATSFAEEQASTTSTDRKTTQQQTTQQSNDQTQKQQQQQQQQQQRPAMPQKRYFRPETVGDPPKSVVGKTKSGAKVALESLKTPHLCDGCNFED